MAQAQTVLGGVAADEAEQAVYDWIAVVAVAADLLSQAVAAMAKIKAHADELLD